MIDRFLDRVRRGPLLLDAAMGTRLVGRGLDLATDDPCLWNLTHAEAVLETHQLDVDAGAEAVFTNTFGANRGWLARFGRAADAAAINRCAVDLARAAAGPDRFVVGSIGPTAVGGGGGIVDQAENLLAAGADALALETCNLDGALRALGALHAVHRPILVGLVAWPDPIAATARRLVDAGATIVGANCFTDLAWADRFVAAIEPAGDLIGWLKPAAGLPGGPMAGPADFARLAARFAPDRAGLLGGCCGTTDAHLRGIRAAWGR